jgi:outer membrane protein assembly factor BamE (lipoprotein component of BamABCDE complex)
MRNSEYIAPCSIRQKKALPKILLLMLSVFLLSSGCATVGQDFPDSLVPRIKTHETTQDQVRSMFGAPWRVGLEDGQQTWTYGRYRYSLFRDASTKDLVIRFDKKGIVSSYSFNTTEHQEQPGGSAQ